MEDLFVPNRNGGAVTKSGKSKFYSELSFEDDFNPTSYQLNKQAPLDFPDVFPGEQPTVPVKKTCTPVEPAVKTQTNDTNEHSNHKIRQPGSPLMCYAIRLKHGDELRKSLLSFVKKNGLKAAFIMSCVGSAVSARVRLASARADSEANYMLDIVNPTEIIALSGTVSGGGHLHVGLSDATGKMVGGHLLELVVNTTAEIVLGDCSALAFSRMYDQSTGFHELQISER